MRDLKEPVGRVKFNYNLFEAPIAVSNASSTTTTRMWIVED